MYGLPKTEKLIWVTKAVINRLLFCVNIIVKTVHYL